MVATLVELFAYWLMLFADVATRLDDADAPESAGAFFLGLALVPFSFLVLAFMSNHPRAPGAVLRAMFFSLVIALMVGLVGLPVGLVAGFGAGGVVALRSDEVHSIRLRWIAVGAVTFYMFVILLIIPAAALFAGGFLPFAAVGFADMVSEYREEQRTQG